MNQMTLDEKMRERGVHGDDLLEALDTMDSIFEVEGEVDDEGIATLYHATDPDKAKSMVDEQMMYGEEDRLIFSTIHNKQIIGYGTVIVVVKIPVEKLILEEDFGDELHYLVEVVPYQKMAFNLLYYPSSM